MITIIVTIGFIICCFGWYKIGYMYCERDNLKYSDFIKRGRNATFTDEQLNFLEKYLIK
jgi:hypothetical protein